MLASAKATQLKPTPLFRLAHALQRPPRAQQQQQGRRIVARGYLFGDDFEVFDPPREVFDPPADAAAQGKENAWARLELPQGRAVKLSRRCLEAVQEIQHHWAQGLNWNNPCMKNLEKQITMETGMRFCHRGPPPPCFGGPTTWKGRRFRYFSEKMMEKHRLLGSWGSRGRTAREAAGDYDWHGMPTRPRPSNAPPCCARQRAGRAQRGGSVGSRAMHRVAP